jgi:VCBS repeat protein/stigma-specific protein Stig1
MRSHRVCFVALVLLLPVACDTGANVPGAVCAAGTAVCSDLCVNLDSDPDHCGSCDNECSSGEPCIDGVCGEPCPSGTERCGDACVDLATDPDHCGDCAFACAADLACSEGSCVEGCPEGTEQCGRSCVDTSTDPDHCGGCNDPCPEPAGTEATCDAGACGQSCLTGHDDCNADPADGCEVTLATDPAHCGDCATACDLPNAVAGCANGCTIAACDAGYDDCNGEVADGCEADLADAASCGACNVVCSGGDVCTSMGCGPSCGTGILDGTETDVDCGGAFCAPCSVGQSCLVASDCYTGKCLQGTCQPLVLGFAAPVTYPGGMFTPGIALGDLDEDGDLDVVYTDYYFGNVSVRLNAGSGTLGSAQTFSAAVGAYGLAIADLDGDTHLDIAVGSLDASMLTTFHGDGNGGFVVAASFPITSPGGLAAGDLEPDGDVDLVAGSYSGGSYTVLQNQGGQLQPTTNFIMGMNATDVALADFDADGRLDVLMAGYEAWVGLALQAPNGTFPFPTTQPVPDSLFGALAADLDGDTHADAVVSGGSTLVSLLGDGSGGLTVGQQATAAGTYGSALADFDRDGELDVAVMQTQAAAVAVWRGLGDGTFTGPTTFANQTSAFRGAAGDLNGDAKPDLVLGAFGSNLAVLINTSQ